MEHGGHRHGQHGQRDDDHRQGTVYVRLVVTASEQGSAAGAARIYELEVHSGGSVATPAAPLVAYAGLNATGRAQRFEAGQCELGVGTSA